MPTYISLIRGINVGGRNLVPMAKLKAIHEALGFENVKTLLQSGNVVFTAKKAVAKAIAEKVGHEVVLRTADELREVVKRNPFGAEAKSDPGRLIVVFLSAEPKTDLEWGGPEKGQRIGSELYVHYVNGAGRSKLTNALIEKRLGVRATARNWNTVTRLLDIATA